MSSSSTGSLFGDQDMRCEVCGGGGARVDRVLSVEDGLAGGCTEAELNSRENMIAACSTCREKLGPAMPLRVLLAVQRARFACAWRRGGLRGGAA